MAQHLHENYRAVDDELRVAFEQTEEAPLAGHETRNDVHALILPSDLREADQHDLWHFFIHPAFAPTHC
jgi:hypothetical protein